MQNTNHTINFEVEFQALLTSWNMHQDLRSNHAPIASLAASHDELSNLRLRTSMARNLVAA